MKTHCKFGHPRTPENLRGFTCKICEKARHIAKLRKNGALPMAEYRALRRANRKTHCSVGHLLDPQKHGCKVCEKDARVRARLTRPKRGRPVQTHCKNGHPRTPENLSPRGVCRLCRRAHEKLSNKARTEATKAKRIERDKVWIDAKTDLPVSKCRKQTLKESGWTQKMVDTTSVEQGGRCAICRKFPHIPKGSQGHPGLCIDHKHEKPPQPRALLCSNCNAMIGFAKENPETCRAAAEYLEAWA